MAQNQEMHGAPFNNAANRAPSSHLGSEPWAAAQSAPHYPPLGAGKFSLGPVRLAICATTQYTNQFNYLSFNLKRLIQSCKI